MPSAVVNFARDHIYKAVSQDSQYHFKLVKMQRPNITSRVVCDIYNVRKYMPDEVNHYYVYAIGQVSVNLFNLLRPDHEWYKDTWVNFADDANNRNINITLYTQEGRVVPKQFCYYSFIDEKSIVIIVKSDPSYRTLFKYDTIKYVRFYTNAYFSSLEFNSLPNPIGLRYESMWVRNNTDKAYLQNKINILKSNNGGDVEVFVNGYYRDRVDLNIADNSYVEYLYDQSIIDKTSFNISDCTTYLSPLDNLNKYLIYYNETSELYMKFFDDYDFFVRTSGLNNNQGLYYYKHNESSCRMVTDKDYGVNVTYVNNHAQVLNDLFNNATQSKVIDVYRRKSGRMESLIYSSLKLHELYKVPFPLQKNVLNNNGWTIEDLRADNLEASDYFRLANAKGLNEVTNSLSVSALGYDSICYYFAYNVFKTSSTAIDVPLLYQEPSTVFEYETNGELIGYYLTTGPVYLKNNSNAYYYEFLYGQPKDHLPALVNATSSITLTHPEFKLYKALFSGLSQITAWQEVTNYTVNNNVLTVASGQADEKLFILYYNEPIIYDIDVDINDGLMYFPLTFNQDRGNGIQNYIADIAFENIEFYLNNNKLTIGLDYFMDFPYVNIVNKKFLTYSNSLQHVQIRMYGPTLDKSRINEIENSGFVNHDVLSRNHKYDLRDDRVLTFYIDGKIRDRASLKFAETDNIVRTAAANNGLPYIVKQPYIPIKTISSVETESIFNQYKEKNKRFSDFFTQIMPEPSIDEFNVIADKTYIFSPTLSKIIFDVLEGVIPRSLYTTPYNDNTIIQLIESNYKGILNTDPIKFNLPERLVEIHPHLGNTIINLDLYQYRFINNVKRVILASMVNFSGYINITA